MLDYENASIPLNVRTRRKFQCTCYSVYPSGVASRKLDAFTGLPESPPHGSHDGHHDISKVTSLSPQRALQPVVCRALARSLHSTECQRSSILYERSLINFIVSRNTSLRRYEVRCTWLRFLEVQRSPAKGVAIQCASVTVSEIHRSSLM